MNNMICHILDTSKHKIVVVYYMIAMCIMLMKRAILHDLSKYGKDEACAFAASLPLLAASEYQSDGYKKALESLGPALHHHYSVNSHHPEHHTSGFRGMNLLDRVEMLVDWMASVRRTKDGNIFESIKHNADRFGYDGKTMLSLMNTMSEIVGDNKR